MSKDRKLDDAELANIAGAGDEKDLIATGNTGGSGGGTGLNPDPGTPGDPNLPDTDDQDGGESSLG